MALAVALLPVLALSGLQSAESFKREGEHQRADLLLGAERSAASARTRIDGAVVLLDALRPESSGPNCEARLSSLVHRAHGLDAMVRFDRTGKLRCASGPVAYTRAGARGDWFDRLKSGDTLSVARAPIGVFTPEPALVAAVRQEDANGRFDGAFVAVIPLAALRPVAGDRAMPENSEVAIIDASGSILTATDVEAFRSVPRHWTSQAEADGSVLLYAKDPSGRQRVYAGAPLVGRDVFVLLSAPAQGLFSWARLNPFASLILPILGWLFALAAVLVVTERVVIRWLGYLDRIARVYAKGRFTVRPVQARNAPLEIRTLAITLDQMADAIDARDHSLHESIAHKDALMREIHHRVKNNLQVISSLLNMQQRSLTDPAARAAMSDTRQRITALALIYRALFQSPDLRKADVRQFLEELIAQLLSADMGRGPLVRTELDVDPLIIDPDKLAPLALWAVEAITNAQKHAFEGRGGSLKVRFKVHPVETMLEVEDDGPGVETLPEDAARGVGRTLMTAFARQLRGRSEVEAADGGGLVARLTFPTPDIAEAEGPEIGNPAAA
ncbi:MAG: sensor histidine kinase [Caulobacteraceae bacterium]|nr:sensor histidine kinase [Caulobacteraceae bacterium]